MKATLLPRLALPLVLLATLPAFRPLPAPAPRAAAPADTRETRQVAAFRQLNLATSVEVVVQQGPTQKVEVVGQPEDLKELATVVEGGKLRIDTASRIVWRGFKGKVTVYVTMPQVEALSVSGSGLLRAENTLRGAAMSASVSGSGRLQASLVAESLTASVTGSGQLQASLTAERLDASVGGSGSLKLSGSTKALEASISGSGRIEAAELTATACEARISGSGTCRVNVTQTLDTHISGSGSVYYAGSPRVTEHISGSGRVRKS